MPPPSPLLTAAAPPRVSVTTTPPVAPRTSAPPRPTGDLWGGVAAMLVALPSAIAYGVAVYAPLGAEGIAHGVHAGIMGTVALGVIAAAMSGSPRLISAPCAPAAAILAAFATQVLATTGAVSVPRLIALMSLVALFTGVLQVGYGALRGGRLIKYIPYPVVSGYLSAVGVIIVLGQLPSLLGIAKGTPAYDGILAPAHWQWPGIAVGAAAIVVMVLARRVARSIPGPIVGLLAGAAAYFACAIFLPALRHLEHNTLLLGPVAADPASLWSTVVSTWSTVAGLGPSDWQSVFVPALTLSLLLSVDTLKTCVVVDALTLSRHNSDRTLFAQGAGNFAAAIVAGMPGAGTMGATLVNIESGGRTRRAGVIAAAAALLAAVVFGKWIAWVPISALAGILIVVGVRMIDRNSFHLARQRSTALDFAVIVTVIVVAVAFNLIAAAGAGVAFAILLFIREQIRGSVIRRKVTANSLSSTQHRLPAELAVLDRHGPETVICELQGSLFFGTTDQLYTELESDLGRCRHLILDLRRVQSVDYTAVHLLEQFEARLAERDGWLLLSRMPPRRELQTYFTQVGILAANRRVRQFETLDDALQWVEDRTLAEHLPAETETEAPLGLGEFELFQDSNPDGGLAALTACAVERSFSAGETIFKGGEIAADELFLIRRGIVRIVLPLANGKYHNLASFGRGHFFGEMSFLDHGFRSAHAVATTACDLYMISRARFNEVSRAHPTIGVKMFARLARTLALRLRHTNTQLRALYDA
ncbi:MAG: SulP family inorganic anion transporter [Opitutaceae bacterium]|nr:SulP family inorganic anion transporter [Opitutaceae bacterium]